MTGLLDVLKDVVTRFDKATIPYFLVGSLATMYYGRPRFTQDVDLVARINARQVSKFEGLFPLEEYYPTWRILRVSRSFSMKKFI